MLNVNRKVVFWAVVVACAVVLIIGTDGIVSLAEAGRRYRLP